MKNSVKQKALKAIAVLARSEAVKSANTACPLFTYQPKSPEAVKKLRKF